MQKHAESRGGSRSPFMPQPFRGSDVIPKTLFIASLHVGGAQERAQVDSKEPGAHMPRISQAPRSHVPSLLVRLHHDSRLGGCVHLELSDVDSDNCALSSWDQCSKRGQKWDIRPVVIVACNLRAFSIVVRCFLLENKSASSVFWKLAAAVLNCLVASRNICLNSP